MWKKILLAVLLLAILIVGGTAGYLYTRKPASVAFEIQRGIRTMFIELQPAWK